MTIETELTDAINAREESARIRVKDAPFVFEVVSSSRDLWHRVDISSGDLGACQCERHRFQSWPAFRDFRLRAPCRHLQLAREVFADAMIRILQND